MYLQQRLQKIEQEINRFDAESMPTSTRGPALNLMKGGLALPQMPTFNPSPIPVPSQFFMDQLTTNQFMPPTSSIGPPMPVPPPNPMGNPRLSFGAGSPPAPPQSSAPSTSVLNFVPTQLHHRPPMRPAPAPMRGPASGFGPGPGPSGPSFQGPQLPVQRPPGPQFVPRSMPGRLQDNPKVVISAPPTKSVRPSTTQASTVPTVFEPPVSVSAPPSVSAPSMSPFMLPVPPAFQRPSAPFLPPGPAGPAASSSSSSFLMPVRAPEPGLLLGGAFSSSSKTGPSSSKGDAPKPKPKRVKPYLRVGGGKKWVDQTLSEWDSNDYRVFVGDLGHEVNDDMLFRSFVGFPSLLKARVIRDKITKKSRGYGFVSFKDGQDYLRAMREMNGKYCGNHPMKMRKSNWRERNVEVVKRKAKKRAKLGLK